MNLLVITRLLDPLKLQDENLQLQVPIPGLNFRGALVNAFLQYQCPYSHYWCKEKKCDDYSKCFVPDELLQEISKVSYGFIICPSCDDQGFLIRTPSTWVICKKCVRENEISPTSYQIITEKDKCANCSSRATLTALNSWICNKCGSIPEKTIFQYSNTYIGIQQTNFSTEESFLFEVPVLIPGYEIGFIVKTENDKFINFLQNMVGRYMNIGGGRSRGLGTLEIEDVSEITLQKSQSDEILFVTPASINKKKLGEFDQSKITYNSGGVEKSNNWDSSIGEFTEYHHLITPGTVIHLDNITVTGENSLIQDNNGLGGHINIKSLKEVTK